MPHQNITTAEAQRLLGGDEGWKYVDVRTVEEFQTGHPQGAYNVPFAIRDARGGMQPNPRFVDVMLKTFAPDARLVIGCASGVRSMHACELLGAAGYRTLANLQGGFSGKRDATGRIVEPGWQGAGLPCESAAPRERSYAGLAGGH
jgi:rhodanese-related sulfurtransferase